MSVTKRQQILIDEASSALTPEALEYMRNKLRSICQNRTPLLGHIGPGLEDAVPYPLVVPHPLTTPVPEVKEVPEAGPRARKIRVA